MIAIKDYSITMTFQISEEELGVISSALKYASDLQKKYEASPNCFEKVHEKWNKALKKVLNTVGILIHEPTVPYNKETNKP